MARLMAIDYGGKRTGLAVSDPLQIIATALETVETRKLQEYLTRYCEKEEVEAFVLGMPLGLDGGETHASPLVKKFSAELKKLFPEKEIHFVDERYTSKMAIQSMIASGVKKKDRRKKENVDKVAATIILQDFMNDRH